MVCCVVVCCVVGVVGRRAAVMPVGSLRGVGGQRRKEGGNTLLFEGKFKKKWGLSLHRTLRT